MMSRNVALKLVLCSLAIMTLCGLCRNAAAQIIEVSTEATELRIDPLVPCDGMVVNLSGPGEIFVQRQLGPGSPAVLQTMDADGVPFPDGRYTYEVRLIPSLDAQARQRWAQARLTGDRATIALMERDGLLPAGPLVSSGTFQIANGAIAVVVPQTREDLAKDILQLDDVIIDGSLCVGVECENTMDFGDDVIRMQENNLRLAFIDTSDDQGTFPTNDWELVANDSSDGGQERFSIADLDAGTTPLTILGGAPDSALLVDSDGNLGLGTSTPAAELHLVSGSTPAIRLEQDASLGLGLQTWELAADDTGVSLLDLTGGGTTPFLVEAGAPDAALHLSSDGYLGLGTASPDAQLDVVSSGFATAEVAGPGGASLRLGKSTSVLWDLLMDPSTSRFVITDDPARLRAPFQLFGSAADDLLWLGYPAADAIRMNGSLDLRGDLVVSSGNVAITESGQITGRDRFLLAKGGGGAVWRFFIDENSGLGFTPVSTNDRTPLRILAGAHDSLLEVGQYTGETVKVNGKLRVSGGSLIVENGNIRIDDDGYVVLTNRLSIGHNGVAFWQNDVDDTTGVLRISDDYSLTRVPLTLGRSGTDGLLEIAVSATDTVDITGHLVINGTDITPDFVFDPGYDLESIEEHSALMWSEQHLPALAPARVDDQGRHPIDVGARSQAVVEELEKAHIYIEQLHERLERSESEIEELRATLGALAERLEQLEPGGQ